MKARRDLRKSICFLAALGLAFTCAGTARKHGLVDQRQEITFYSSQWVGTCGIDVLSVTGGPTNTYSYQCDDNDTHYLESWYVMPENWDGGTLIFDAFAVQTATDTGAVHSDVKMQCRGNGETVAGWGVEVAVDIAALTGDDGLDVGTSAEVTPAGSCNPGDFLWWHWEIDAAGTTASMATVKWVGFRIRYGV